ncbi:MAG: VWA domain-containing protein [Candidatus Cloacimonetes bacterium]|nr:VWA domain-containing protein [Candidatus Cloacimonadota bacterium]
MKKFYLVIAILLLIAFRIEANGVCIIDAEAGSCLFLQESIVNVTIENQVCIVTSTQRFVNPYSEDYSLKYAFPLYEDASVTDLRWQVDDVWYAAVISPTEPDTIPGGSNLNNEFEEYLGETPLYFSNDQVIIEQGGELLMEITYVQLLPYAFGNVDFYYPNDYSLIQPDYPLDFQSLHVELTSLRTIEEILLLSHTASNMQNSGYYAEVDWVEENFFADTDYHLRYSLNLDELGLFSMSTLIDPEDVPDDFGNGFFTFIAEPDPDNMGNVISKVFTLIIDRSGSMSGDKIVQARGAASFIVNNLNEGDMFNLVDFSTSMQSFQEEHVLFNPENQEDALGYIANIYASGSTNISGAFDLAVPQFEVASDSTANIIIFFTDGLPTAGITNTTLLLEHVNQLILTTETGISLHTFGIGQDADPQLLTLLASQNNGFSSMLGSDELEEAISLFYQQIRYPVLLNTEISISPDNVISEVYPEPLPDLYQGFQMIVSGRYFEPQDVTILLTGDAFGAPVEYEYEMSLSDSIATQYQFLTKIWAKSIIEHLLIEYHSLVEGSPEAEAIKEQIIQISIGYGVLCPFTSFVDPGTSVDDNEIPEDEAESQDICMPYELLGNYPNPFNPETTISFRINNDYQGIILIRVYNAKGQFVKLLTIRADGENIYKVIWDATNQEGEKVTSGIYFYTVEFSDAVLSAKMILIK